MSRVYVIAEFIDPDAPTVHKAGRKCEDCPHILNRYVKVQSKKSPYAGSLLCDDCVDARIDNDLEAAQRTRKQRAKRNVAMNLNGTHRPPGFLIPGLKDVRLRMGKTQEWIGVHLGVGGRHISDLERGHTKVSDMRAKVIADVLGVSVEELRG